MSEYNIIVLVEKKSMHQLNIGLDNLPTETSCHITSNFHEGIYQVMRYNYDLIIITVMQSTEFTKQAIEGIRRLKNTPILAVIPFSDFRRVEGTVYQGWGRSSAVGYK